MIASISTFFHTVPARGSSTLNLCKRIVDIILSQRKGCLTANHPFVFSLPVYENF